MLKMCEIRANISERKTCLPFSWTISFPQKKTIHNIVKRILACILWESLLEFYQKYKIKDKYEGHTKDKAFYFFHWNFNRYKEHNDNMQKSKCLAIKYYFSIESQLWTMPFCYKPWECSPWFFYRAVNKQITVIQLKWMPIGIINYKNIQHWDHVRKYVAFQR